MFTLPEIRMLPCLVFLACLLPTTVQAEMDAELILGSGPDDYRSREVRASADFLEWPVMFDIRQFVAHTSAGQIMNEVAWGLAWTPVEAFAASYHHKNAHGDLMNVYSNEYGLSYDLASLWNGPLQTRLDLGLSHSSYNPNAVTPAAEAAIKALLPKASHYSFEIKQDLTDSLGISLGIDDYRYSKDPVEVARTMLRRVKRPNNGIFEIIGFPDHATSFGVHWTPTEAFSLDFSRHRSITVLDQIQNTSRLGAAWHFNKHYQMGAAVSRSTSSELRRNNGAQISEASGANYLEVSARLLFD